MVGGGLSSRATTWWRGIRVGRAPPANPGGACGPSPGQRWQGVLHYFPHFSAHNLSRFCHHFVTVLLPSCHTFCHHFVIEITPTHPSKSDYVDAEKLTHDTVRPCVLGTKEEHAACGITPYPGLSGGSGLGPGAAGPCTSPPLSPQPEPFCHRFQLSPFCHRNHPNHSTKSTQVYPESGEV